MRTAIGIVVFTWLVVATLGCRTTGGVDSAAKDESFEDATGVAMRAMFLPGEPVLKSIGDLIASAQSQVDIAIYMVDTEGESPLIRAIKSQEVQSRLASGELKIRMIFEGSRGAADSEQRSQELEAMGIDVRHLASGRKVHHKFALVDPGSGKGTMMMGTANWTLGTEKAYTEAVVFMRNVPGIVSQYANEFAKLWGASNEYGEARAQVVAFETPAIGASEDGLNVFFNTDNFTISGTRIAINSAAQGYVLTRQVVAAIDRATPDDPIRVAMTRISLKPVYDALVRAAGRGVPIYLALNQENFVAESFRAEQTLPLGCDGDQAYKEECSTSKNYAYHLQKGGFPGDENVHVRIKYYNHDPRNFLGAQLHAKYFLIWSKELWVGSFNWSHSSEYKHIENLLFVDGEKHTDLVGAFVEHHQGVYDLNRRGLRWFMRDFERDLRRGRRIWCQFKAMSLTFDEIDEILATPARVQESSRRRIRMPDCAPTWARD